MTCKHYKQDRQLQEGECYGCYCLRLQKEIDESNASRPDYDTRDQEGHDLDQFDQGIDEASLAADDRRDRERDR